MRMRHLRFFVRPKRPVTCSFRGHCQQDEELSACGGRCASVLPGGGILALALLEGRSGPLALGPFAAKDTLELRVGLLPPRPLLFPCPLETLFGLLPELGFMRLRGGDRGRIRDRRCWLGLPRRFRPRPGARPHGSGRPRWDSQQRPERV
jgi:hypothetical protein